ncbi:MAG TPA: EamA family transporter [Clostridia bacterium]|nr:EamA family transporter [Clostridia bacterium]
MKSKLGNYTAAGQAILAAALFGMSAPFSKLLLEKISPIMLSSLLYLGAGMGMLIVYSLRRISKAETVEAGLTKKELPFIVLMILLDVSAPVSLLIGLTMTSPANASLLNNFEIVATSIIALIIFKEAIGKRLWTAILFVTVSSMMLTIQDISSFSFSIGSVFVLLACTFWGLENNCTRKLSLKDPVQIVIIKGFGSGICALIIAVSAKEIFPDAADILLALLLGLFAYGMSILFYVTAQRQLGAARTSTYYAVAPFIGVGISYIVFSEPVTMKFIAATAVMLTGTYFALEERHGHQHCHEAIEHEHRHNHSDGHHNHIHQAPVYGEHSHLHLHDEIVHVHEHMPDIHHAHQH